MESKHGSESNKHPSPSKDDNNSINEDDALSPLISVGESDHDSETEADVDINIDERTPSSGNKSRSSHPASSSSSKSSSDFFQFKKNETEADVDIKIDEKTPSSGNKSRSSHPASSPSSKSSSDFFQMDAKMLKKSSTFPASSPKVKEDSHSPKEKEKNDKPDDMSSKSEDRDHISPTDASSQIPHAISNPTSQTMSPVQLPPRQVMERSGDYDPDRIPASVFGSRPSSAMEWSAASNDSLFSLNIGNNSFSREQFLMMSGDMSGEDVNKSGELYNSGELNKPGEANTSVLPPLSPIGKLRKIRTMDKDKKNMDDKKPTQTNATDEDVSDHFEKVKRELDGKGDSSMINRLSDGSSTSCQSFAFPILVDTTKYTSVKGPFPRKQDPKLDVYAESPQMKTHKKKSSSTSRGCSSCCCYCCSLPECSCASSRHCCSWKWFKKWCCCFCCCDYCSSLHCSCPSSRHCWSWKWCKEWCCCCCYCCL